MKWPPISGKGSTFARFVAIAMWACTLAGAAVPEPSRVSIQVTAGSIAGSVQDYDTKAFIPGAIVKAVHADTGALINTLTKESGRYSLDGLQPGRYTVSAAFPGCFSQSEGGGPGRRIRYKISAGSTGKATIREATNTILNLTLQSERVRREEECTP